MNGCGTRASTLDKRIMDFLIKFERISISKILLCYERKGITRVVLGIRRQTKYGQTDR